VAGSCRGGESRARASAHGPCGDDGRGGGRGLGRRGVGRERAGEACAAAGSGGSARRAVREEIGGRI
jgi:hypothetical protein